MEAGIVAELETVDPGDERLNQRARKLAATLAADVQASINGACQGWAETKAAYRFPQVKQDAIAEILANSATSDSGSLWELLL